MITAVHTWGIGKQNGGVFISEDNFRLINSWKNNSGITDETAIYEKVETVEKQLFGKYQRQQITDASELPYRIVGEIGRGCTATLIGPKHILTAAHCVYDVRSTQWSVRPIFTPGQVSNGEYPLGKYVASKIYIQKDFMERAAAEYDFAVLELKEPIGDKLGWGNLEVIDANFNKTLRITGYPVDKILDTMWTVTCPVKAVGSQLQYRCDTYNGMSGSSLMSANPNSHPAIYGVHSGSENDYNAGVMINQKTFDLIESWVKGAPLSDRTMVRETKF